MSRASMLVSAVALLLLAGCIQVVPASAPSGTPTPATPITREQAIQIAFQQVSMSSPGVTAVENPRNPVARLMTEVEWAQLRGAVGAREPDRLVWVVQFQGTSYSAGIGAVPRTQYSYATVAIDAQSGQIIGGYWTFASLF